MDKLMEAKRFLEKMERTVNNSFKGLGDKKEEYMKVKRLSRNKNIKF